MDNIMSPLIEPIRCVVPALTLEEILPGQINTKLLQIYGAKKKISQEQHNRFTLNSYLICYCGRSVNKRERGRESVCVLGHTHTHTHRERPRPSATDGGTGLPLLCWRMTCHLSFEGRMLKLF